MFKNLLKTSTLVLALALATTSFSQTRYIDDVFSEVELISDVPFAVSIDRGGNDQTLLFDLYQPKGDTDAARPLIILCSEGSFLRNDKADAYIVDYAERMVKKGYVVASIQYRIGWTLPTPLVSTAEDNARNIIPAAWRAIQDFKASVRFFKKSIVADGNPYKIDPSLIIGGGFGAGAYLPMNSQTIDRGVEFTYESMLKKNENTGIPDGTGPYIDTNLTGLGGIFDKSNGSPGYSSDVPLCLIYSGAMIDTAMFEVGSNPMMISVHGIEDETTPYKSDIVNAQVGAFDLAPIILVHGTYHINRISYGRGENTFFQDITTDGFPQKMIPDGQQGPLNMYKRGLYSFVGEGYMPWSDEYNENSDHTPFMDTLVTFTAHRLKPFIDTFGGVAVAELNAALVNSTVVYPTPATTILSVSSDFEIEKTRVININGKVFIENDFSNGMEPKIDIEKLPAGNYLLEVNTTQGKVIKKFIKE